MKNHGWLRLPFVLVSLLLSTQAFADEATKPEEDVDSAPPVAKSESGKAPNLRKSPRPPAAWCGIYSKLAYLTGEFSGSDRTDRFVRDGLKIGASCNYNNNSRLSLGIGAEFYIGKFHLDHEEDRLRASASYLEMGFKEWGSLTLDLHPIKIRAVAGVERTNSGNFTLNSMLVDLEGNNDWLDVKNFAKDHLSSSGDLEIWEAGAEVEFPFRRRVSFTFGGLWQRYDVNVGVKLDAEGKRVLEAFEYDVSKVDRQFKRSRNFFYLTPGAKRCGEKLCASLVVPWGVFQSDKWSWGLVLGTEMQF